MTEFNVFCWSKKYNGENSFQQSRYRVFNTQVSVKDYDKILKRIREIFGNTKEYSNLTHQQILDLSKLPHFSAEGFKFITGLDVPEKTYLSGKRVKITIDGQEYSATVD